ncbi:uncharacterized protein LOC124493668 isoform X2 [Dermatophagoides farinae]
MIKNNKNAMLLFNHHHKIHISMLFIQTTIFLLICFLFNNVVIGNRLPLNDIRSSSSNNNNNNPMKKQEKNVESIADNVHHHHQQQQQQQQPQQQIMNSNIDNNNGSNNGLPIDRQQQQQQQQQQPPYSYQQNQFQSSISCGQLEFYVQLTFDKPFKGLVYAYKMFKIEQNPMITNQQQQQIYGHYYYPIEILDSCTIRGNGASIVYLELSFLSECIEKLQPFSMMNTNFADNIEDYGNNNNKSNFNDTMMSRQSNQTSLLSNVDDTLSSSLPSTTTTTTTTTTTMMMMNENNDGFINTHTINLDGFNFRRALNNNDMMQMNSFYLQKQQQQQQQQQYYHHHYHHQQQEQRQQQQQQQHQLNISKDDTYQLSLYIQNDPKIEQKYDSKVIVQCSPRVTKNIIMEHNSNLNDFYRKMDDNNDQNEDEDVIDMDDNDDKTESQSQSSSSSSYPAKVSSQQQYPQQHTRSIMPKANLTITSIYDYYQQQQKRQRPNNNNNNNNNDDDGNIGDHHHNHHHHHHMMNNEIDITNLIESRMDILRGRIPFLKLIDNNVELGDDVTLIIRTRQLDDYDSRISTCYAYDEHDTMRYELTNQDGCPVDSTVMTAFKVMHNVGSESKVYYTTFPAFKFPGSQYLNIQCTLLVCRQICPNPTCDHNQHSNRNTQQW